MMDEQRDKAFVEAIVEVYRRFGRSIGHEDEQGAFLVEPLSEGNVAWLRAARFKEGHWEGEPFEVWSARVNSDWLKEPVA